MRVRRSTSGNPIRERRAKRGSRALLLMRGDKKGHRAVHVADPDLDGAGVKIESALLVEIGEIDYSVTGARSRRERIASRRSSFATGLVR
jgi:hypothetical protein